MRTTSIIAAVVLSLVIAPHVQAASGCNQSAQKGDAEGGAGGNWQPAPGAARSAKAQANAGGTQVASAEPCK